MLPARVEFISWGIFPLKMTLTESPVRDSLRIKWARAKIEIQMLVQNKTCYGTKKLCTFSAVVKNFTLLAGATLGPCIVNFGDFPRI